MLRGSSSTYPDAGSGLGVGWSEIAVAAVVSSGGNVVNFLLQ
jgi:hypothetical protein